MMGVSRCIKISRTVGVINNILTPLMRVVHPLTLTAPPPRQHKQIRQLLQRDTHLTHLYIMHVKIPPFHVDNTGPKTGQQAQGNDDTGANDTSARGSRRPHRPNDTTRLARPLQGPPTMHPTMQDGAPHHKRYCGRIAAAAAPKAVVARLSMLGSCIASMLASSSCCVSHSLASALWCALQHRTIALFLYRSIALSLYSFARLLYNYLYWHCSTSTSTVLALLVPLQSSTSTVLASTDALTFESKT
jgi:hypothetical protein